MCPEEELATGPGCHCALTLLKLGEAAPDPCSAELTERQVLKMDGLMDERKVSVFQCCLMMMCQCPIEINSMFCPNIFNPILN